MAVEDLVTPDTLDVLDRRVYDLAVSRAPLAQIAVQLGVNVSQAEERIQRVCARLGVTDRAALREWAPKAATEAESEAPALELDADAHASRRHSRRAFIAAAGGGGIAALGGGVLAWKLLNGRSDGEPGAPEVTPTSAASVTPETEQVLITPVSFRDTWEVKTLPKGELIDWPHGLFLMGVVGGEVRGHRLKTEQVYEYRTWPGGRFVSAAGTAPDQPPTEYLMDVLNTDVAWAWDPQKIRLVVVAGHLPEASVLFEKVSSNKGTGEIVVFSTGSPGEALTFSFSTALYPTGFDAPVVVSESGKTVAVASVGEQITLTMIDLERRRIGGAAVGFPHSGADGARIALTGLTALQGAPADSVLMSWRHVDGLTGARVDEWAITVRWDMKEVRFLGPVENPAAFSTDGLLYVREIALRDVEEGFADGPREYWPAVEIVETSTGKVQSRVRSAAIYYGDGGPSRRWLGGDAFAALVRAGTTPDGYDFGIISTRTASGNWGVTTRYAFEPDPAFDGMWFQSPWVQGVVPSPYNPEVVALGKFATLNIREGHLVKANVRTYAGPAHIDPWAAGPGWLTFAFPHGGHGGASPPVLLQPKFESPDTPIESPLRFKVSAQGDRLNLREQPSLSGKVIAALEDGSALVQAEDASRPAGRRGLEQAKDGTWVFVRTPGGVQGWVNSAYLAWA